MRVLDLHVDHLAMVAAVNPGQRETEITPISGSRCSRAGPSLGAMGAAAYGPQRELIAAFAAMAVAASAVTPEIVLTPCCSVP